MDLLQNLLFAFLGRLFEAIDIVSQQACIDTSFFGKASNINLRMRQKEALHFCRFRLIVGETLEAYIHIQFPPMDSYRADFILLAFRFRSHQQILVPKQ